MDYLAWTEENIAFVQAAIAIVLTIVTAVYVLLTSRLLNEARRQREQSSRPSVVAYLKPHEAHINLLFLYFENTGAGAAHHVGVTLDGMSNFPSDVSLATHGLFTKGAAVMPPGARIEVFLLSTYGKWEEVKNLNASVTIKYGSDSGKKYEATFPLDFSQLEGYERVGKPPLYDIAKYAEELVKVVNSWPGKRGRFEVNTHSVEDVESEREADTIWVHLRRLSPEGRKEIDERVRTMLHDERTLGDSSDPSHQA